MAVHHNMPKRARLPCLVLASGGIDSTACLAYYAERRNAVSALFVDYGQPARAMEQKAARAVCRFLRVRLKTIRVTGSALASDACRGRNALLLTLGLMAAEFQSGLVCLGVHAGTTYPDCSPAFLERVQRVYDVYVGGSIRVDAPFVRWSKRDVYDFSVQRQLPLQLTYSCLLGRKRPCGQCESCKDVEAVRAS